MGIAAVSKGGAGGTSVAGALARGCVEHGGRMLATDRDLAECLDVAS